ncbi:MAG: translation initiation factor IF-6 [Acidilobaceae archaeon]
MKARGKFEVMKLSLNGNPNIGVYIHASDNYVIVPPGVGEKEIKLVSEVLNVDNIVETTIFSMRLIGVLVAGNNNGLLLPRTINDDEYRRIREALRDINIAVLDTNENALGNLVASNSRAAVIYQYADSKTTKIIEDTLGVEVIKMQICNVSVVGSVLVVTDRGGLVCPEASDDEVKNLNSIFKVPVLQGTVNFGVSFIRVGLIANSMGAIVGEDTTGPEIARIQSALGGGE